MRRRFKKYMVLCLAAMLLCIGPAPAIRADSGGESGTAVKKAVQSPSPSYRGSNEPEGMKLAAENDYLALYIDERETDVAVAVKASGDIWYSNPPAALEDEGASAYYQKQMKSQISLTYFNANMQSSEMDNYNDSILGEQFEILYGVNGVTVVYTMGKAEGALLIPYAIRADRMDGYLARMEESAAKKVKRNYTLLDGSSLSDSEKAEYLKLYPALETQSVYVLKSGAKDYVKEELSAYFEAAGYSAQERDKDAQELGIASEDDKPWFKIPLQYTLEEDNLLVTVDPGAIEYNTDGYYLAELDLMKYFGAAGADEEGYLFVPDGSGALINLNNGKTGAASYSAAVYGQDKTMNFMKPFKSEADESLAVKMPVFGLKAGNRAWFAIIEEGDGYGEIHAEISGVTNSYNNAYASFSYLRYGPVAVSEMIGSNSFQMYSRPVFEGKYALRYAFLSGEASDYSGMAEIYRNYMIGKGWLKQKLTQESASFFVEFVGAIEKYKSFLAVKYRAQEALTTFSQAAAIVSELKESGVGGIKVKYSGWSGGGLKGNAVTDTGVASCLNGGGLSLKDYTALMKARGIPLYLGAELQYVYQDKLFDGYNRLSQAPRYFDNTVVYTGEYYVSNNRLSERYIQLISPGSVARAADSFLAAVPQYGVTGVACGSISYDLYSDMSASYIDRQGAIRKNSEAMALLSEAFEDGLLGENPNAYAFRYMDTLLKAPMDSNRYRIIDEAVPFYEMVLRGYIDFAGEPLNLEGDYQRALLKTVESGGGLYYLWIAADNSVVADSDFNDLYSVNYSQWMERAAESYSKVNAVFAALQGQIISKHEKLSADVYKTTYELGTEIAVNYGDKSVTVDGVTVGAGDFAVLKEGR